MGITRYQQWMDKITSRRLAAAFGMEETITHLLMKRPLYGALSLAQTNSLRRVRKEET